MKPNTILSGIQETVKSSGVKAPGQIKSKGALSKRVSVLNKADKAAARSKNTQNKANAKETSRVVAKQQKELDKSDKSNKKPTGPTPPSGGPDYSGRKNIVNTPHGPAVDLDAVEKDGSKKSPKKVPVKKKKK